MKEITIGKNIDLSEIVNSNKEQLATDTLELPKPEDDQFFAQLENMKSFELPMNPEEAIERRKVIIHIKSYISTFPEYLEEFKKVNWSNKSLQDLNNMRDEIKLIVCNANNQNLFVEFFGAACEGIESIAPMVNYDLTGLQHIACNNQNIIKCVKEISLEYQNVAYIAPEKRLTLLMLVTCNSLNKVNKTTVKLNNCIEAEVKDTIKEKYDDL